MQRVHMRGRDRACDRACVPAHAGTQGCALASVTMSRCVRAHERVSVWVRACVCVRVYARACVCMEEEPKGHGLGGGACGRYGAGAHCLKHVLDKGNVAPETEASTRAVRDAI